MLAVVAVVACGGESDTAPEEPAAPAETAAAEEAPAADPVAEMQAGCAAAAEAIAARQAETSLYDRLGGRDAIHAVMKHAIAKLGKFAWW